jgi:hypothetical protein
MRRVFCIGGRGRKECHFCSLQGRHVHRCRSRTPVELGTQELDSVCDTIKGNTALRIESSSIRISPCVRGKNTLRDCRDQRSMYSTSSQNFNTSLNKAEILARTLRVQTTRFATEMSHNDGRAVSKLMRKKHIEDLYSLCRCPSVTQSRDLVSTSAF